MLKLSPTRTIIRGDSDLFKVSFIKRSQVHYHDCSSKCIKKEEKTPIDITGWEVRFTVRPEVPDSSIIDDDDALISIEAEIVNAEEGIAVIYVQSEDTSSLPIGNYLYDIQVIRPADEYGRHQVNSIRRGKYVILGDITRNEQYVTPPMEPIIYDEFDDMVTLWYNKVISDDDGLIVLDMTEGVEIIPIEWEPPVLSPVIYDEYSDTVILPYNVATSEDGVVTIGSQEGVDISPILLNGGGIDVNYTYDNSNGLITLANITVESYENGNISLPKSNIEVIHS